MKPSTAAKLKEPQNRDYFNQKLDLIIEEFGLQADSRERVKEVLVDLKTKFEISPTIVRKLAKAKADDKLTKVLEENSEIVNLVSVLE
jgi:hypothetical protein